MDGLSMIIDAGKKASEIIEEVPDKLTTPDSILIKLTSLAKPELPWIVLRADEDLKDHYKKLLKIQHDDDTGHLSGFWVGLAMIGCINTQFYSDIKAKLAQELVELVDADIDEFAKEKKLDIDSSELSM